MSEQLDLGPGRTMQFGVDPKSGQRYFIDEHPRPDTGAECGGSGRIVTEGVPREEGKAYWAVESTDPLTLTPSLRCTACGDHGWVRDGAWVPA